VHPDLTAPPLQEALLDWWPTARRDLPWRRTRDPWAILVSELMLQQTQVVRVVPRFEVFLSRFPTPRACAAAAVGDVVRAWAGLGYNRRAVNLHAAARVCVERHRGRVPEDLAGLLALPGVGPYTARAVLAFATGRDHGVLDTNAARVLARLGGRRLGAAEAQARADDLVPPGRSWEWNQAVLDLGATACLKRAPRCPACPLASWCAWDRAGHPDPDPATGSAGASGLQPAFAGSDRQGRGRLVAALRRAPVSQADLAAVAGWPADPDRAERVARSLVADGLAAFDGDVVSLP
jgi:A/G-specific adenine glycosylase